MRRRRCALPPFVGLLSVLSLFMSESTGQHVIIGDVSTRDISKPVYDVSLPPLGGMGAFALNGGSNSEDEDIVRILTARGQAMDCSVPSPPEDRSQNADGNVDQFEDVEELLEEYRGKCFRREEGWWSYVFCYGMTVEQLHVSTGKNDEAVSFTLGTLDPDYDSERRKKVAHLTRDSGIAGEVGGRGVAQGRRGPSDPDAPFTQLYGNGTICDLNGRPREITVKYKCNQDAAHLGGGQSVVGMNFISALREIETCVYEIDFVNEQICKHPAYKKKLEKNVLRINCVMAEGEDAFQGLSSTSYQKASLNL